MIIDTEFDELITSITLNLNLSKYPDSRTKICYVRRSDNRISIFPAAEDAVRGNDHGKESYEEEPSRSHRDGPAEEDLKGQGRYIRYLRISYYFIQACMHHSDLNLHLRVIMALQDACW